VTPAGKVTESCGRGLIYRPQHWSFELLAQDEWNGEHRPIIGSLGACMGGPLAYLYLFTFTFLYDCITMTVKQKFMAFCQKWRMANYFVTRLFSSRVSSNKHVID